jgi:CheY-like chemotaxis protein
MGKKILVIEDDQYTRDLYKEILTNAGFAVTVATDGQQGFQMAKQGGYDLVLLDVMMPNLDGLGVLKELQLSPPANPNKQVVMITNIAHDPIIDEAMKLGAKTYISKADVNPEQLVTKVKGYLKD